MTTIYYVATLARYCFVEAADEADARELGRQQLMRMYDEPEILIRTVRPATSEELRGWDWYDSPFVEKRLVDGD